jgi:ActR/RegA family two-component response regulator
MSHSPIRRVALVGHCGFDAGSLRRFVQQHAPHATVTDICDPASLQRAASPDVLLLINRVLDGSFADDSGIELIREMAAKPDGPRMLLISNYADAQAAAVEAGARPGFGKSELGDASAVERFKEALR